MTITLEEKIHFCAKASRKVRSLADRIISERFRQIEKWGPQTHPSGTGPDQLLAGWTMSHYATLLKNWNDNAEEAAWAPILLEEIFEALESTDINEVRKELIESMAVIAAWIEDIDEKGTL